MFGSKAMLKRTKEIKVGHNVGKKVFQQFRGYTDQGDGSVITWLIFGTFFVYRGYRAVSQLFGTMPVDKELL